MGASISKVEIVISTDQDPDRVARIVAEHIERLARPPSPRTTWQLAPLSAPWYRRLWRWLTRG